MNIAERLSKNFKFVFTSREDEALLQLSGPIETRDQLDAVVEALGVMRDWLPASAERSAVPSEVDAQTGQPS